MEELRLISFENKKTIKNNDIICRINNMYFNIDENRNLHFRINDFLDISIIKKKFKNDIISYTNQPYIEIGGTYIDIDVLYNYINTNESLKLDNSLLFFINFLKTIHSLINIYNTNIKYQKIINIINIQLPLLCIYKQSIEESSKLTKPTKPTKPLEEPKLLEEPIKPKLLEEPIKPKLLEEPSKAIEEPIEEKYNILQSKYYKLKEKFKNFKASINNDTKSKIISSKICS